MSVHVAVFVSYTYRMVYNRILNHGTSYSGYRLKNHKNRGVQAATTMALAGFVLLLGIASSQDFSTLLSQGQSHMEKGRYETAERLFRNALDMRPGDPSVHYYLGVALLSQGKHEAAARSLEKASSLSDRPNAALLFQLGTTYLRMNRLDDAEMILAQAVGLSPNQAALRLQLGWVYYQQVEGEKARQEFTKAIELEPSGHSYYYLALAEHALGNIEEASSACQRAIELQPDLADAHVVLGKCLLALERFKEAKKTLRQALELNPDAAEAHLQLGLMALRDGNLEEAASRFETSVEADPTHQSAWYNLALVYTRLGRKEEAHNARARYQQVVRNAQRLKPKLADPNKKKPEV